jgi:dTDP-4-dehydrorhamnose reductase
MKKTVLIFGISSFVGSNLALILKDEYRVIGTFHKTPVKLPGVTCLPCDVLKKDYVTNLVGIIKPDITIYAVGLSSLTECKVNPKLADALNTSGAVNCCVASERNRSKFVYLSSCFVLGGEDQVYKESDIPFPNTAYGTSLSSSEFYVQRSCLNYLILRCSPLYGRSYSPLHPNWFESLQTAFAFNEPLPVDDSVTTGFLDVFIIGRVLKTALEMNVTNRLFQVSSRDHMTRYDFSQMYAKIFKKDGNIIQKVRLSIPLEQGNSKIQKQVTETLFYRLDTSNITDFLGAKMPSIEESLTLTSKRLHART